MSEAQVGAELTYDHFRPQSQSGSDDTANLVYACHACNEFKGDYWSEAEETRLLHPLTDDLALHITDDIDGTLRPTTHLGEVFIHQIRLNRTALVANRLERQRELRMENRLAEMSATLSHILAEVKKKQP